MIDQWIKYWIVSQFVLSQSRDIIPHFFYLTYVKNTGGAWSVFQNVPHLLIIINLVFLFVIIQYIKKKESFSKLEITYWGCIIGGVLGNLIDRIRVSGVIDYIGLRFGNYSYPIFNFADIMIVLGVFLVIIEVIRGDQGEYRSRNK